jgi:hypothetical protein
MGASVVAGCDTPPILELCEKILDFVALTIQNLIVVEGDFSASGRRDAGLDAFGDERTAELGAVIAAIGDQL